MLPGWADWVNAPGCLFEGGPVGMDSALAVGVVTDIAARPLGWRQMTGRVGLVDLEDITRPRPSTGFIWHPDAWSFIVALLAGTAGALALALAKQATMVGVFISVTTVPAAGNLALGLAFGAGGEIAGSAAQLGLNIAGMVIAGAVVLVVVRLVWARLSAWSERLFGRQADLT